MDDILSALSRIFSPISTLILSLSGLVSIILGAINDPEGFVNTLLVKMIDNIAYVFPSTPDQLKVGAIIDSVGDSMPLVGKAVVFEVFQTISIIFSILVVIKIYKLIPFKAT